MHNPGSGGAEGQAVDRNELLKIKNPTKINNFAYFDK